MKERNRTHLNRVVSRKVRLRPMVCWALALLLCFISVLTGSTFLLEGHTVVRAASSIEMEKLTSPVMNPSRSTLFDPVLVNSASLEDLLWHENPRFSSETSIAGKGTAQNPYRVLMLDEPAQRDVLRRAPMEFSKGSTQNQLVMTLPMPDGKFARFRVEESPVMSPRLAALHPEIRTYRGQGLDDPTATTRFDVTPDGFHAIVLSSQRTVIIEPAARGRAGQYVSYDEHDAPKDASLHCLTSNAGASSAQPQIRPRFLGRYAASAPPTGTTLRTYRLALAATAEYTQTYGGGTVNGALSAITTTINGVTAIYERDLAIRLQLVNNETSIIFTNPATDPYTSDNANSMLTQNQAAMDQRIGQGNYDIGFVLDGHVYGYQPGFFLFQGAGQFQSVCVNGQKGKGVTILRSIEPSTISAIWNVAHEIGHQFGALHTFNGTTEDCGSSRFAQVAYEPGGGSTIMGYRGATAPNGSYFPLCTFEDLHSTDTYFHAGSIDQIVNFATQGSGSFCPQLTATGNNPPAVQAGPDYTIPAGTPFTLTASATDPEADALTYCWEEYDLGAPGPPHTDNGNRPIFRSFAPAVSPARTLPQVSDILSGTATFGESLPVTTRSMNFRVTVRDNHSGGGGVNSDMMLVNVRSDSGPFLVTQPGSSTTWTVGSNQTVTWNVANTSAAPVACGNVRILLSIDGGNSFPFTLAATMPNTGSATVTVPNTPTSTARVKVEAIGNIFFNISLPNFVITPNSTAAPTLLTEANTNRGIAGDSVWFTRDVFALGSAYNFSFDQRTRISLFAVGLDLMPGENASVVTAQADYAGHGTYPLTVEYVGKVPNFDWLTQVNMRLPNELANAGDVLVSVSLRGAASNKVLIGVR